MDISLYSATFMLLLVMDPLGNIPLFMVTLKNVPPSKRKRVLLRECLIALLVLLTFLFAGKYILNGMQLSNAALGISGGIILFLIALKMIFPRNNTESEDTTKEPFIVPLAIPFIAGPSSMAVVMLIATRHPHHILTSFGAVILAWSISTTVLYSSEPLSKLLKERGLAAIERLMGMILTTMAVQMLLNGIKDFFHF